MPQLVIQDLRLSNPTPAEGERIKVYARIANMGNNDAKDFWAIFYWTSEIILNPQQAEKYIKPEYEIHREYLDELGSGGTKVIVFEWEAKEDVKSILVFAKTEQ